jgi:hypothetical protein
MDRRTFISSGLALSSYFAIGDLRLLWAGVSGSASGPYLVVANSDQKVTYAQDEKKKTSVDVPGEIVFYNLATGETESYPVSVYAHVFEQHPAKPSVFAGTVKWTTSGVVFDRRTKSTIRFEAPAGNRFFGHVSFSEDGERLYATINTDGAHRGALAVYSCDDWKLLRVIPLNGFRAHECARSGENEICIMQPKGSSSHETAAGNKAGRVTFFDTKQEKIIQEVRGAAGAAHICRLGGDNYVMSGGNTSTSSVISSLNRTSGKVQSLFGAINSPAVAPIGEGLSVCAMSPTMAAITIENRQTLVIWDLANNRTHWTKLEKNIYGVVNYNGKLWVNNRGRMLVTVDNAALLADTTKYETRGPFGNGRHIRLVSRIS